MEWKKFWYKFIFLYERSIWRKKWAFVSDYARLKIIYDEGGIYLDTDVELIKSLDDLLEEECFLATETTGYVATGLGFGAEKGNKRIDEIVRAKWIFERTVKKTMVFIQCAKESRKNK